MRRAAAGHRVGVIVLSRGMRGGARFVPADRGGVVAIAERKTIGDELASHARHDGVAHLAAGALPLGSILKDLRRRLALAVALVAHIGMADVAAADRLAFDFVAAEEGRSAPAGKRGGKLPAEIDGIAQAGVEAKPRGWMIEMGGVASKENAAVAIGIRHYVARNPAADRDDLVRYALADHVVEHALDVDLLGRVVILFAAHAEPVELAAVEDDEIAPEPLGLDEVDQRSLAHDVMLPQLRRLHEDAEEVAEIGRAAHGHAELAADHAVPAAAVDRITGDNAASLVARKIVHGRDDMVVGLGELIEAPAIAQGDAL